MRDGRLTFGLCQFNASSLHDEPLTGNKSYNSHCMERNPHIACTSFKRWIGISYQCCDVQSRSCECSDIFSFARGVTLLMISSIFCTNNRRYLNLEILKPVSLISTLATPDHRNHLSKMITKQNINSAFSATIDWPYYRIMDTNMRPSVCWWLKH